MGQQQPASLATVCPGQARVGGVFIPDPLIVTEGLISGAYASGRPSPAARGRFDEASSANAVVAVSGSGANARVIWRATSGDAVDVKLRR